LCRSEYAKPINSAVFPGIQGGPLMHVVAGKAVCFAEALLPSFKEYGKQVVANAKVLADSLMAHGLRLISGGTDNHLVLVDVTSFGIGGKIAEKALDECGITVNMNMIPFDTRKPMDPSGIRIGAPALTTRGMGTDEFKTIATWIATALKSHDDAAMLAQIREDVRQMASQFPVPAAGLAVAV
jgi:glycine hydroxymethyltransferase